MKGSCHCGAIAFEVEGAPGPVLECNCSHCQRKGFLLWFVPRTQLRLENANAPMTSYFFNKHAIEHRFCPTCGTQPFAYGKDPKTGTETAAINVRCLEGIDLASLQRMPYDGRSM